MSRRTTLCLVNVSGKTISSFQVSDIQGFESASVFVNWLKNVSLADNASHCGYLEIDNSGAATYKLRVNFEDGTYLSFSADQEMSLVKHSQLLNHEGSASGVEVYLRSGGTVSTSYGTSGIYIRTTEAPDNSNWIGDLLKRNPNLCLNQLTMPGSHDAGIYEISYFFDITSQNHPEWVKTQHSRIGDQLVAGSRYFDLRIRNDRGILQAAHWSTVLKTYGALGANLNDILEDVASFLRNKGKQEVVILKFSHNDDEDLGGIVVKRVKDILGNLLYNPQGVALNLATARLLQTTSKSEMAGKVVAVFGGDGDGYNKYWKPIEGIFPYFDMQIKNASDSDVKTPMSRLYVYDHYSNDGTVEVMTQDQLPKLTNYGGHGKKYLFLLSWTLSGGGSVSDIEVLAGMANPWISSFLNDHQPTRPNIVFLDFVDPYICKTVIATN